MPFKSENQRKLCWVMYNRDIKAGKTPKWNCHQWEKETKNVKHHKKKTLVVL